VGDYVYRGQSVMKLNPIIREYFLGLEEGRGNDGTKERKEKNADGG